MSELDDLIQRIKEQAARHAASMNPDSSLTPHSLPVKDFAYPSRVTPRILFAVPTKQVIEYYYQLILRRPVDAQGLAVYQPLLERGMPALMMLFDLSRSPEGRSRDIPIEGLGLARFLYYIAKLAKKIGCQRPIWRLLHHLANQYRCFAQTDDWSLSKAHLDSDVRVDELAHTVHQLLSRHRELATELEVAKEDLERSRQQLENAHTALQVQQHQQLLQIDATSLPAPAVMPVDVQAAIDAYYLAFEDAHRGPSKEIQAGLNDYEAILQDLPAGDLPALDLGCGRGEWLLWLQERGIAASGVDGNPVMVQHCQARGLTVHHADLLQHLQSLPDRSVRLVSSFHVIEHLPFEVLFVMMTNIHRVLVPGGLMILETPNPENILVGSHTFHHDFSHRSPITPTSIEFLAQYQGFVQTQIMRRNPYPASARVVGSDPLTERVNGHLCGPQDFALIARTPVRG